MNHELIAKYHDNLQLLRATGMPMLDVKGDLIESGFVGDDGCLTTFGKWVADGLIAKDTSCEPEARARALINGGFYQTSRAYRMLARLPFGKSGKEALYEAEIEAISDDADLDYWRKEKCEWVNTLGERASCDQFLRVWSRYDSRNLTVEVSPIVFDLYRDMGGGTAR